MATSPTKPFRMAPLQRLTVKPIEDPAEQAALDERIKRRDEAVSEVPTPASGSPGAAADAGGAPVLTAGTKGSEALPSTPSRPSTRKRRR